MRTRCPEILCTAAVAAMLAWTPVARAQGSSKAAAEALFEEGRKLMAEGKFADACPKFADSEQLDASPSTLLNLANCYEKGGRTASAWAAYKEAASLASAVARADLLAVAQRRADALAPKLSRVTVVVPSPAEGLEIKRDGVQVTRAEWGLAIPIDPGAHAYEATAPGRKAWSGNVEIPADGTTTSVTIPALEAAPAPSAAAPPPSPANANAGASPAGSSAVTADSAPAPSRSMRVAGAITAGVGVVALGIGAGFALSAKSKYDASLASCPHDPNLCTPQGVSQRDDARAAGNVATVAVAVGAAALVGGAVLWLVAPAQHGAQQGTSARLELAPTLGGAMMRGQW